MSPLVVPWYILAKLCSYLQPRRRRRGFGGRGWGGLSQRKEYKAKTVRRIALAPFSSLRTLPSGQGSAGTLVNRRALSGVLHWGTDHTSRSIRSSITDLKSQPGSWRSVGRGWEWGMGLRTTDIWVSIFSRLARTSLRVVQSETGCTVHSRGLPNSVL